MRFLVTIVALGAAQPCLAQVENVQSVPPAGRLSDRGQEGWSVTIGVAPVLNPAWQGSKDMTLSVFPDLRVNYKDVIFASIPEGLGWNVVNENGWKAGPLAKVRFGRDEERGGSPFLITGGSDALLGLGDVDAAAELGGFVEKRVGPWRGRLEVRRGFGGHEGVIADGAVSYQARSGRTIINAGPRATVATKAYIDTYFGIDAVQAQRSGLPAYSPSGGLLSYGVGGSVIRPLNRRSAVTLFTGLDQLAGDAGDSPLVRERGRLLQFTLGLGYGVRFNL
ncbi:MipA/OmpV family protein [Novosphingobium sp. RD2P27]|uniref:MipA/OmpV family protein n=1 Tax=Novosphingobium kalidii TaxID=3230299 RepID=A0ABV2D3A5_9SPHN